MEREMLPFALASTGDFRSGTNIVRPTQTAIPKETANKQQNRGSKRKTQEIPTLDKRRTHSCPVKFCPRRPKQ
jgi:hypothetical protein